jgi:hypothetical protein
MNRRLSSSSTSRRVSPLMTLTVMRLAESALNAR